MRPMKIPVYNTSKASLTSRKAPEKFILEKINRHLIWEVIRAENANQRQGTHKTKTRGEVRGGGGKPWRQKGTGRARSGSNRSPVWKGGGVTFGPSPRNYRQKLSPKKKHAGYLNIIAQKIKEEKIMLVDRIQLEKTSTSGAFTLLQEALEKAPFYPGYSEGCQLRKKTNDQRRKITMVTSEDDTHVKNSFRNIPWVNLIHSQRLAARPILYNYALLLTEDAFKDLTETL